jgi:cobalt-zinc-cadmium efflux system protein
VSRIQRLGVVLALNLALVGCLIVVGVSGHSVGLLAEGGDYLLDAAGAGAALLAIRLSGGPSGRRSQAREYQRATSIVALANAGWLLLLELLVAGTAADRLISGTPRVDGLAVLVASGIAALVMAVGALVLHGDVGGGEGEPQEEDLSVAAVLLDTVADAAAAAGVAVAGGVILATRGWYWLDPAVALGIAIVVAYHAYRLIRKVMDRGTVLARSR